jgi:uncharacterized BrkB/YihY/UPF0761 family membrane protein
MKIHHKIIAHLILGVLLISGLALIILLFMWIWNALPDEKLTNSLVGTFITTLFMGIISFGAACSHLPGFEEYIDEKE